jgi:hypothetical protein
VGKTGGDIKLILPFAAEDNGMPLTIAGRTGPQVHRHIKDLTKDGPDQFALGVGLLKVKTPEYPLYRTGLVILDKGNRYTPGGVIPQGIAFKKIAPAVPKHPGLNFVKTLNGTGGKIKGHISGLAISAELRKDSSLRRRQGSSQVLG